MRRPVGEPLPEPATVARPIDHRGDRRELARLARLADRLAEDRAGRALRQADAGPSLVSSSRTAPPQVGPAPDPRTRAGPVRPDRQLATDLVARDREGTSHRLVGSVEAPASA